MNRLAKQLIKLGHTNPELRDHIRPILNEVMRSRVASVENLNLNDLKLNSNTRIRVNDWISHFDPDAPELQMMGGRGYFPANPDGLFQDAYRPLEIKDLRETVDLGNNTIVFGVASHGRRGVRFGRGFLTSMPSFDASNLARQGIECVRIDDVHNIWYCFVPFTY